MGTDVSELKADLQVEPSEKGCMLIVGKNLNLVNLAPATVQQLLQAINTSQPRSEVWQKEEDSAWRIRLSRLEGGWWFEAVDVFDEVNHYKATLTQAQLEVFATELSEILH